jgi:hypothetical protein
MDAPQDFVPDTQFTPDAEAQPQAPAPQAAQSGSAPDFVPDSQFQSDDNQEFGEDFGTSLEAGFKGFARGLTLGQSDKWAQEQGFGVVLPPEKAEDIKNLEEQNPGASMVGNVLGSTAGLMGAEALTGVNAAIKGLPVLQRVGAHMLKGAIETGVMEGGNEISKSMLGQGDPDGPVSSALAHMGAAALFGGAAGGIFGTIGVGLEKIAATKAAKLAGQTLEDLGSRMSLPSEADMTAETMASKALPNLKPEAGEVMDAADRLNLPIMNGMVSGDKAVQMGEDALLHGPPSPTARGRQSLYNNAYQGAMTALDDVAPSAEITKAQAGQSIQDGITKQISSEYAPIQEMYDAIHEVTPNIPLSKMSAPAIARNILNMPEVTQTPNSPMARFARSVAENIQNATSVEDISFQRKALKDMANSTIPGERRMAAIIGDKLSDWETNTITRYATSLNENLAKSTPEEQGIFKDVSDKINNLLPKMQQAKGEYAPFIQKVAKLSDELGKGKIHGPQDALDFIKNLDFEQVTNKLVKKDNSQFRGWFAQEFPDQFKVMQDYQKSALRKASSPTGEFSPKIFFNKINSMEPEIKQSIFNPDDLSKVNDIQTYIRSFPKSFNPSGTNHMDAFRSFFESPKGMSVGSARDFAIKKFIVGEDMSPKILRALGKSNSDINAAAATKALSENAPESMGTALNYADKVERGAQKINTGLDNIFKIGVPKAVDYVANESARNKVKKFIDQGGVNQQIQNQMQAPKQRTAPTGPPKFAEGGEVHTVQPDVQSEVGNLGAVYPQHNFMLNQAKGRVFNYLQSLKPQENPNKLPFDEAPDTKEATKKYDHAIDLSNQPLSILNQVKDGSLTINDMKHMTSMYPELYKHLSKQLTAKISENQMKEERPNYATRQGLSLFLGAPMDSTFMPQNIQAAQSVFMKQKASQQAPPMKAKKSTGKMGEMSKNYQTQDQAAQSRQIEER